MTEQNNEQLNETSQDILRRVEQNDATLTELQIGNDSFSSTVEDNYSRLGISIATNTHITTIDMNVLHSTTRVSLHTGFYDSLRQNYSIQKLMLRYIADAGYTLGDVGNELLRVYQDNKRLTELNILHAALQQNELEQIAMTLRSCTNLESINLYDCGITDQKLLLLAEAIRGHSSLKALYFNDNEFGNIGCQALATLLEDPNSNIEHIQIEANNIRVEGATILANSLANNTKLQTLYFDNNHITQSNIEDVFIKLVCDTSSINSIHSSNHTFEDLSLNEDNVNGGLRSTQLKSLLLMNEMMNKTHVAIIKILKYHPNIDMVSLYNWDIDGERTLKSLPYVIAWFDKARESVNERRTSFHGQEQESFDVPRDIPRFEDKDEYDYQVEEKKLSAIYQFASAMPLQFVPATHIKREEKKQKKDAK